MWYQSYQGNIGLSEQFTIPAANFTELAEILGQFHNLAKKIEAENAAASA
jgi:hypothetical protein